MDTIKAKISDYLVSHPYLRLGTVNKESKPQVHTVGYVSEGCTAYFVTDRKSRKAENILKNPAVAYAVDENYEDIMVIQGVQMEGKATLITMETEAVRLLELMAKKFPGMEDMPPNPELVIFKIEPTRGYFLDNTVAFGHRDLVEF
ncbi:MAG: pyridoxamine 5'-phosphate oxidase family protein [Deltaproteobacteria bacterium]|nr:MAG: pyridoxamine 5'-phosphate oxidase family protein [Deltaproteobacteria bacterium]